MATKFKDSFPSSATVSDFDMGMPYRTRFSQHPIKDDKLVNIAALPESAAVRQVRELLNRIQRQMANRFVDVNLQFPVKCRPRAEVYESGYHDGLVLEVALYGNTHILAKSREIVTYETLSRMVRGGLTRERMFSDVNTIQLIVDRYMKLWESTLNMLIMEGVSTVIKRIESKNEYGTESEPKSGGGEGEDADLTGSAEPGDDEIEIPYGEFLSFSSAPKPDGEEYVR